jgi:predicted nucleic acid-binding protein
VTGRLLLDNSAWARLSCTGLSSERLLEVAEGMEAGQVVACLPFLLEAGYSSRNAVEHRQIGDELLALPWAAIDATVERRAVDAQRQLARAGHHRLPPVDVLLAAIADQHQLGVLHYDADYDLLAEKTDLDFESVWLAERGSL